jgi:hypothetical protein
MNPGSGKTTLLSQMLQENWLVFDDYKAGAPNLIFRNSLELRALVSAVRDNHRCVVADIDFCNTESREEAESTLLAEVPGVNIGRRFFENDPEACETNIRSRNRHCLQDELRYLHDHSPSYCVPQGADPLPVGRSPNRCDAGNWQPRDENRP